MYTADHDICASASQWQTLLEKQFGLLHQIRVLEIRDENGIAAASRSSYAPFSASNSSNSA